MFTFEDLKKSVMELYFNREALNVIIRLEEGLIELRNINDCATITSNCTVEQAFRFYNRAVELCN